MPRPFAFTKSRIRDKLEIDGPWQIGQMQASEYGRKARDVAQQMRVIDRDLKLLA